MKKENNAKRDKDQKGMQKFKIDHVDYGDDGLLEELGGLEDSEEEQELE